MHQLIARHHQVTGVDLDPVEVEPGCDVMHICYPFEIDDFIGESVRYIERYAPKLTVVNSTVAPGTTRAIYREAGTPIVHSPVRGKHWKMAEDMLHYAKFVGGIDEAASERAAEHFRSLGMRTKILAAPEATELAKLTETTYFGVLIAWAQEVERYCDDLSLNYDQVISFYSEIDFFPPVKYFPGVIGGHCVMPNIQILKGAFTSRLLDALEHSNELKIQRENGRGTMGKEERDEG